MATETAVLVLLRMPSVAYRAEGRVLFEKGRHKMNPKEIAAQQIKLMAHVEVICEKQGLVRPIEVIVVDADGNQYDFEYRPEDDGVDLPPAPVKLPLALSFTDVNSKELEQRLFDIAPSPGWHKRFVQ